MGKWSKKSEVEVVEKKKKKYKSKLDESSTEVEVLNQSIPTDDPLHLNHESHIIAE